MKLTSHYWKLMMLLVISILNTTVLAGQKTGNTSALQFRGNENHGLVMATMTQIGASKANIRFTIKNRLGITVGYIEGELGASGTTDANRNFDAGFLKLEPGTYYIAGYRGDVVKKSLFGTRKFRFYKRHTAFHFKVNRGLTAYLGNIKFDFTNQNSTRVSVIDRIVLDLALAQKLQPRINFLTLDRQVIDPRREHRHRQRF